jgi:formylglycine-generating enzyme
MTGMQISRLLFGLGLLAALSACTSISTRDGMRDCAHCPEMVVVPAGTAILGANATDPFRNSDEMPERSFAIREPFAVSKYEITRDQYEAFVRATKRAVHGDCLTDREHRGNWVIHANTTFRDPGFVQTGVHPVACVSWDEAQAYVAWLNTQADGGYRLLTEVEWEYVARGGASQNLTYPWSDEQAEGCPFANGFDQTAMETYTGMDTSGYKVFDPLSCADGWLNTAPVGSLAPSKFGIYDMIGNVAEWVEDCYSSSHDGLSAAGVPPPTSASQCSHRIVKGGSWGTLAHNLRTAERVQYPATHRDDSVGIRVAKTLL